MATLITDACINCGACEHECPNGAISEGSYIYEIDRDLCTECVGFFGDESCQMVCPVECCVPDVGWVEEEVDLLAKAIRLHGEDNFPKLEELDEKTSRFRNKNWINRDI